MRCWARALGLGAATAGCFFFFWLCSFVLSWSVLPLARLTSWRLAEPERNRRCQAIVGYGFVFFIAAMRTTRLITFRPQEVRLDVPDGPFVMIANHPTLIDVSAIMSVHPRMCCVAKRDLFRSLLVSQLLRSCGHIEGGQVGPMDGAFVVRQALERLASGQSVLVFPEGTRSPACGLHPFQPGVFEIAARASVPLVPILITCQPPTLMKHQPWYALVKTTADYRIAQLETIYPGEFAATARETADHVREAYRQCLGLSDSPVLSLQAAGAPISVERQESTSTQAMI